MVKAAKTSGAHVKFINCTRLSSFDINNLKNHINIDFGSQIRNYVLEPYKLVKDLRTGEETSNADAVLNGEIKNFMESYLRIKR